MSAAATRLDALLDLAASHRGDDVVLRVEHTNITYAELDHLVGRWAGLLADRNVDRGSRVVLSAGNSADFVAVVVATWRLQASVVLVSTAWRSAEVERALGITSATHLVHDGSGAADPATLRNPLPAIHIDEIDSFLGAPIIRSDDVDHVADTDDVAVMVFSSGTTGLPKAVRHSHRTLLAGTSHWVEALGLTDDDRLQITTPPFHILGLLNLTAVIAAGASVRLHRRFDLDAVLSAIETDSITIEMAVAPIALAMANHPNLEEFDLSSLRYIMWGATPVTPSVAERITRRTGVRVLPAYGASEFPVLAANPISQPDSWRLDSVGLAPAGVTLRAVDPETGRVVAAGQTGELQARGDSAMVGYLPDHANADAFQDGWYRTGDIGSVSPDGWVTITDRLKEMIKVNGFQVAPAEVEAVLLGHRGVADCAVFGVPDRATGEQVVAAVVRAARSADGGAGDGASGVASDVEGVELRELVAGALASYKQIGEVLFVDQIPRLPSGKVLRRELQSLYRS
jgi:long-chain acyl-CoA synthetase